MLRCRLDPGLRRRIRDIETAYAFARHVTPEKCKNFLETLDVALNASGPATPDDECSSPGSSSPSPPSTACTCSSTLPPPPRVRDLLQESSAAWFSIHDSEDDAPEKYAACQTDADLENTAMLDSEFHSLQYLSGLANIALDASAEAVLPKLKKLRLQVLSEAPVDTYRDVGELAALVAPVSGHCSAEIFPEDAPFISKEAVYRTVCALYDLANALNH